jgi:hypothetical protein
MSSLIFHHGWSSLIDYVLTIWGCRLPEIYDSDSFGHRKDGIISPEDGSQGARQLGAMFVRCARGTAAIAVVTLVRAAFKHKGEREQ